MNKLFGLDHDYQPYISILDNNDNKVILANAYYATNYTLLENGPVSNLVTNNTANSNISDDEIRDIVAKVGLSLDTIIENHGENLSLGQKQLIHLLNAFSSTSLFLVFDEPDSAINKVIRQWFYSKLNLLVNNCGVTAIVVSHNFNKTSENLAIKNYNYITLARSER